MISQVEDEYIPHLISVIIPVFNRTDLLFQAIESVLRQRYKNWECFVVDDGSPNKAASAIANWIGSHADSRIHYIRQDRLGVGAARNHGLRLANGEYIQFLDSDDLLHPDKFSIQVDQLKANPTASLSYCITVRFTIRPGNDDKPSNRTGESFCKLLPYILEGRIWHTLSALWRKKACDKIGPWSPTPPHEDWEYECRAAILGITAIHCPSVLCYVRSHTEEKLSGHPLSIKIAQGIEEKTSNILALLIASNLDTHEHLAILSRHFLTAARRYYELNLAAQGRHCLNRAWSIGNLRTCFLCTIIWIATFLCGATNGAHYLESAYIVYQQIKLKLISSLKRAQKR